MGPDPEKYSLLTDTGRIEYIKDFDEVVEAVHDMPRDVSAFKDGLSIYDRRRMLWDMKRLTGSEKRILKRYQNHA